MNVTEAMYPYWDCKVIDCIYDIFKGEMLFTIIDEQNKKHPIKIIGISSLTYLSNTDNIYDPENTYYEMSDFQVDGKKFNLFNSKDKFLKQFKLDNNICLELWNITLIMKAQSVLIDEVKYNLPT